VSWIGSSVGGDCATIKYNSGGESLWCAMYNGPGNWADCGRAIACGSDGAVYVAGSSDGVGTGSDMMTIKYVQSGGMAERAGRSLDTPRLVAAPTPFHERTQVKYVVVRGGPVRLAVFDATGRFVRTLVDGQDASGEHVTIWDATDDSGTRVPAGVYVVTLACGAKYMWTKVVLID
jgi:hypothetical protein